MTTARTHRRLPGFRFEPQPQPPAERLPRMDVAVFVGFAAAGPLDLPVAVEDASQFEAVFGAEAPLAWDRERGERVLAYLAPAVRAFFRNGGRRCWVVRVAGSASGNLFPLTGLARLGADGHLQPAFARSRAKGSWSDSLQAAAVLTPRPLVKARFNSPDDFELEVSSPDEVVAGDLLRLTFEEGYAPLVVVKSVETAVNTTTSVTGASGGARRLRVRVRGGAVQWFRLPGVSPTTGSGRARLLTVHGARIGARVHVPPEAEWRDDRPVTLNLQLPGADAPALGSFVRATLGRDHLWLRVDSVRTPDQGGGRPGQLVQVSGEAVWWYAKAPDDLPRSLARCEKLLFELLARRGDDAPTRLAGLAFTAEHPRFWSSLPDDERLYRRPSTPAGDRHAEVWGAATDPRFPLAGREQDGDDALYFPVVMPTLAAPYLGPLRVRRSALQRDGLATFNAKLFLDFGLDDEDVGVETLLAKADFIRYQSPRPRHLRGIHAALSVEEATIISVPDAAHRGWAFEDEARPEPEPSEPLPHPEWAYRECDAPPPAVDAEAGPEGGHFLDCGLRRIGPPALALEQSDESGTLVLSWSSQIDARRFVVEESSMPDGRGATLVYAGTAKQVALQGRDPRRRSYFRVRAEVAGLSSEWEEPDAEFDADGTLVLTWPDRLEAKYVLEEATRADWEDAAVIYDGRGNRLTLYSRHGGDYFYRVRAVAGRITSDWSRGVAARVGGPAGWSLRPAAGFRANTLLEVHVALLRMCAARGDLFALLSLPEHYRDADAIRHAEGLRATSRMRRPAATQSGGPARAPFAQLGYGEQRALSYGALYHPWLVGGEGGQQAELRRAPPCGAAAGVMALRASERGAWVAPANEPLRGVLALTPSILPSAREALQDAQVNLFRREPRGFLALAADTLSDDPDLRPVGVRRLLILLRRAALRLGATYVFEPHGETFRRLVKRGFEGMLGEMFQRGAFAGATPSASFRVNTGSELNTPRLTDEGRFVVELKVAPSLPLTFLTLRLVQSGDRGLATEER